MSHDNQNPVSSLTPFYKPGALTRKHIIELHYMYGFNVYEISDLLNLSPRIIEGLMNKARLPERNGMSGIRDSKKWLPGINIPRDFHIMLNETQEIVIYLPERGAQKRAKLMVEAVVESNDIEDLIVVHRNGLNFDDRYTNLYLLHPSVFASLDGNLSKIDDLPEYCFISFHDFYGMEPHLKFSNENLCLDQPAYIPREDICLVLDSPNKYFNR